MVRNIYKVQSIYKVKYLILCAFAAVGCGDLPTCLFLSRGAAYFYIGIDISIDNANGGLRDAAKEKLKI